MSTEEHSLTSRKEPRKEPLIPPIRVTPQERNRLILVGIAVIAIYWLLTQSLDALGPFIIALVLAYLTVPLIDRLDRFLPRAVSILIVYVVFIGCIVAMLWWLLPLVSNQLGQLLSQIPDYYKRGQDWVASVSQWYNSLPLSVETRQSIENGLRNAFSGALSAFQQGAVGALSIVTRTTGFLFGLLIIPFFLFYVIKDHELAIAGFNNIIPRSWRNDVWRILRITNGVMSSYIRGQLLLGLVVGVATTVGMIIIGAPYALILGIISGLTEVIPVIGPILGSIPGIGIALFSGQDLSLLLKVVAVYIIVQQLENNLLVPKIQGDSVKMHPAMILVVLVVGSQVGGFLGLLVAVPVSAIVRDVYIYLFRRFAEDYTPREAELSVPSRHDEETPQGKEQAAKELEEAREQMDLTTEDEIIAGLEDTEQTTVAAPSK